MAATTFEQEARKSAMAKAIELANEGQDLGDGAIVTIDPRAGTGAEMALVGAQNNGLSEQEARRTLAELIAKAEQHAGLAVITVWYVRADLEAILFAIRADAAQARRWLYTPPQKGTVRLLIVTGTEPSMTVQPYASVGQT